MKTQVKPCLTGHVVVVGAGNTAMDAARVAKRMGAESSTIVYRRTKKEMPADEHELKLCHRRGRCHGRACRSVAQENGKLKLERMKLGEPDASWSPLPGCYRRILRDSVRSGHLCRRREGRRQAMADNGIEMERKGPAFKTNVENVWCAGDAHRGPATVVEGIADAADFAEAVIGEAHTYEIPRRRIPPRRRRLQKRAF